MPDSPLDPGFAVFNGHINDADKKARAIMRRYWPNHLRYVEKLEKEGDGIMYIFQNKPTPSTMIYVAIVTALANEGRVDFLKLEEEEK